MLAVFAVFNFFKLEKKSIMTPSTRSSVQIRVNDFDEDSDDADSSIRTSVNTSRASKISQVDDDNNNEKSVTPTLNNSIPRVSPTLKIVNSTPLNHYNHQNGLSNRKYRRDLTKLRLVRFELLSKLSPSSFTFSSSFDTASPVVRTPRNTSQDRESFICKKLCFQDEEFDDL